MVGAIYTVVGGYLHNIVGNVGNYIYINYGRSLRKREIIGAKVVS